MTPHSMQGRLLRTIRALNLRRLIPHSLQGRLLLTFLALNLLSMGGFIAWSAQGIETDTVEQAEHDLEIQSHLIADGLREAYEFQQRGLDGPAGSLASQVRAYAQKNRVHVTIIDTNFKEIASSDLQEPPGHVENHPEVLAAQSGVEQHDIRWNEQHSAVELYVATAIKNTQNQTEGYVQLSVPMAPIYADVRQSQLTLLGVGGLVLVVTALASLVLARQIARPIRNLTSITEEIAQGHLERRVTPAGPDEIQRLGHAFNQMTERVSSMLTRQKEFVANAAHELRSPLTSLRLRMEILTGQARGDPELTGRYLKQMDRELEYLQQLVEQLLALSALDENERLPRMPLDLAPLLYQVCEELSPLSQRAQIRFDIQVPPHLPPCNVNAGQVRIILRNLLDNAIKYTPAGGRVILRAEPEGSTICISVADTGPGIPAEALPHIFDRFYRVDKSRSTRPRGSGLGLALVRAMVEANEGQIQVTSAPQTGSAFTVKFPELKVHVASKSH